MNLVYDQEEDAASLLRLFGKCRKPTVAEMSQNDPVKFFSFQPCRYDEQMPAHMVSI